MYLTAINIQGEALPEAADQLEPTLGSRCRCQSGAGSEELCQGASKVLRENISNEEYSSGEASRELSRASDEAKARVPSPETRERHLDLL